MRRLSKKHQEEPDAAEKGSMRRRHSRIRLIGLMPYQDVTPISLQMLDFRLVTT